MALQNQQGQLVQTDDASTQQLAKLQGAPVTPTTPTGVAGMGASPDQAKMAGTPNQKQNALTADQQQPVVTQQPSNGQNTLQQADRTEAARTSATDTEEQAQQKASQLQSLGSLQTRVQALISQDLALKNPAQAQASQTKIQTLPAPQQAQAQQLIQQVAANPNDPTAVAAATQFWVDNGWGTIDSFTPSQFMATAQEALGSQAEQQVQGTTGGQVTLQQVQLQPDEVANLTQVFGDNSWQQLTVPQLSQKIEDMRQAQFNTAGGLQAQLATATGAQRQELLSQLGDLGQVGQTGAEQSVKNVKQQVDQGDSVNIGGTQYKVEDLLKDQSISNLVGQMLNDPQLAAKVAQTNPEFATWVKNNAQSLTDLSAKTDTTMGQVRDVNTQTQALAKVGNTSLNDQVMQAVVPNWGKVQSAVPDVSKSGVISAIKDPTLDATTQQGMANALNRVGQSDPATLKTLAGMSKDDVTNSYQDAQLVKNDGTGLLAEITGSSTNPDFVTDQAQQKALSQYQGVVQALDAVSSQPGMQGALQDPATHSALVSMIKDGSFTAKDAQLLAQNPSSLKTYVDYHQKFQTMQQAAQKGDLNTVLSTVFGTGVDASALDQQYQLAKQMYNIDPQSDGGKMYKEYQQLMDPNNTGHLDASAIMKQESQVYGGSLEDFLGGKSATDQFAATAKQQGLNTTGMLDESKEGSFFQKMQGFLSDGKLSNDELDQVMNDPTVSTAQKQELWNEAAYKGALGGQTQQGFGQYQADQASTRDIAAANQFMDKQAAAITSSGSYKDWTDTMGQQLGSGQVLNQDQLSTIRKMQQLILSQAAQDQNNGRNTLNNQVNALNALIQKSNDNQHAIDDKAGQQQQQQAQQKKSDWQDAYNNYRGLSFDDKSARDMANREVGSEYAS